MQTEFLAKNDFENFLMAEFNPVPGALAPSHDRFEAGMRHTGAVRRYLAYLYSPLNRKGIPLTARDIS